MSDKEDITCINCDNEYTVLSESEEDLIFCPYCGDEIIELDEHEELMELNFDDE